MKRFFALAEETRLITLVTGAMLIGILTGRANDSLWASVFGIAAFAFFLLCASVETSRTTRLRKLLEHGQRLWKFREDAFFSSEFWQWIQTVREELHWTDKDEPRGPIQ